MYDYKSKRRSFGETTMSRTNNKIGSSLCRIKSSDNKMIDLKNMHAFSTNEVFYLGDRADTTPIGYIVKFERPVNNEIAKKAYDERIQNNIERRKAIDKLKRDMQNLQNPNYNTQHEDIFRLFHNKITLVSKYPKIKDLKKRIKVNMGDFRYTSLKDVIKDSIEPNNSNKQSMWNVVLKDSC